MRYTFYKRCFNHLTLMERFCDYNIKERKKHCGRKNKSLTFYVIRPQTEKAGLMSLCNFVAWRIRYAIENDYIPVVDMKKYRNMYLDPYHIGVVNSYEYYFEQPTHFSLEEAYQSCNVIVCDIDFKNGYSGIDNHDEIAFFNNLMSKYMKFNSVTSQLLADSEKVLFPSASILGVLGRGTDYASIHPSQHAIVPNSKELINIVDEKYKEWGGEFDYIYLATEDEEILKAFIKHYGRKIISINTMRYETETHNKYIADIMKNDTREDRYQKGLDYLKSVYLLSKCDSIITPIVGGGLASVRMNGNKYRNVHIIDMGLYK